MVYVLLTIIGLSGTAFFDFITWRTALGLFFLLQFIPGIFFSLYVFHACARLAEWAESWAEWWFATRRFFVSLAINLTLLALAIWLLWT